ncbi:Na(+)/H(+) antiporter subunit F [Lentibacillus sp. CBA3610]|nr:Na(+)/H(+) antiporter subunit F [Lentibacillus sp. CBA3610]
MTESFIEIVTIICLAAIVVSLVLMVYRIITGPTHADRLAALHAIGINMMGITALIAILIPTTHLNNATLLIGIFIFMATLWGAKYLEGVTID